MRRWICRTVWMAIVLGTLIGVSLWGQVRQAVPAASIATDLPFFGSASEWSLRNEWVGELVDAWNSLGFGMARQHMLTALLGASQGYINAYDFIGMHTASRFWVTNPDYDLRIYGGVPWSVSGSLFLEDSFFGKFNQTYPSYVSRVIAYEPLNETDSGFYRGQLIDADRLYNICLLDYSLVDTYFPRAKKVMPSPTGTTRGGWDYMQSLLKRGFADLVDFATVHPYRHTTPESLVPVYANMRSLIASYSRSGRVPSLVAGELGYSIEAVKTPETGWTWYSLLNPQDWRTRRWAKYWQRLFLVQRYCDVPTPHMYQWAVYSNTSRDGLFFPLIVLDNQSGTIKKTLAYYSVENFMDFYMLYEYYARVRLSDPSKWVLIFRSRKPSSTGLRRNEWLLVAWDRETDANARGETITLPIYGAKGIIHNFLSKANPSLEPSYPIAFEFGSSSPMTLWQFPDGWDGPSQSEDPHPLPPVGDAFHDASPFYYVLERFEPISLPEIAWRVTEHVTVRAGDVLRLRVEGFCPRNWYGLTPNRAVLRLRGHGVDLSASFAVEPGRWFSQTISLPWNSRRAALELVAELSFWQGLSYRAVQTQRSVWVSVSNPIDCRLAPMQNGLGLLLSSRDFAQSWTGRVRVDVSGVGVVERDVSLAPGGSQTVRVLSGLGTGSIITVDRIQLIDSSNSVVAEWGRRRVNLLWLLNSTSFPLWVWTWNGTVGDDRRPDPGYELVPNVSPPVAPPFAEGGSASVARLSYHFGCLNSDRAAGTLAQAMPQSVVLSFSGRVNIPPREQRAITEVCVWLYATEPWVPLWSGIYDQVDANRRQRHESNTWLEADGQWRLVSFYMPHLRNVQNNLNTEYISSNSIGLDICGVNNIYSAGPGELYIGPIALIHYEEEEL